MSEQYPDLGITQKQDGDYWDVVIPDLDCDTDYALQVAWIYSDKSLGSSEFSDRFNFRTVGPSRVCPINVVASWDAKAGLNVSWQKNDNRVKNYVITLTAGGYRRSHLVSASGSSLNYSWVLTRENNIFQFGGVFRKSFTSFSIQSVYGDGSSDECPVTVAEYVDPVCSHTTLAASWNVVSQSNGILVSWQDSATGYGTYRETRVYVSETPSPYNWELRYTGIGPASIILDTLATVYVKLNHLSYSECESLNSDIKEGKAYDPIVFDDLPPENNFDLGSTTVEDDSNGLFNFDKKILFTWTQNTDTSTSGYRIRYKTASDSNYTYMSVPGRATVSTYLYGLKAGQTYQIAVTTYDVYGNDNSVYKQYPNIVIPSNTSLKTDVAISAGDMKLGYGIGGDNSNKGLYIAPENYWYVTGNTSVSSAARFKVGGVSDWLYWNGTNLEITGKINANAGAFTGSVDIGTALVDGQLRVTTSSGKFEIGKLTNTAGAKIGVGIQGTDSVGKLFQLDTVNGIIANKGTIAGWTIDDTSINKAGNVGFFATTTPSDVAIWAGGSRTVSPNFSVTYAGKMIAKDAVLKGMVQAGEGGFGILVSDATTATGYKVSDGWTIDSAKIVSTNLTSQVTLDGLQGSIIGGNIVGSNHYFMSPSDWTTAYPGEGSGNPGNVDYISSSGNFRLANGDLTYDGTDFKVKTDLIASNVFLGSGKSFSNDYLLGKSTTIGNTTKPYGSFSLADGKLTFDGSTFNINLIGANAVTGGLQLVSPGSRLPTDGDSVWGDQTVTVSRSTGYLNGGRVFYYGGNYHPQDRLASQLDFLDSYALGGDIYLSRKA
jgi:hypothetical protein